MSTLIERTATDDGIDVRQAEQLLRIPFGIPVRPASEAWPMANATRSAEFSPTPEWFGITYSLDNMLLLHVDPNESLSHECVHVAQWFRAALGFGHQPESARPLLPGEGPVRAYADARAARGDPGRSEQMAEHRNMRASDADRAHIAEQLRRATDEGRLLAHEFDDRLGQALNARTYGELDAIVDDLPREPIPVERPGRVGAVLRRRRGPVLKAAAAAGAVAATVVVVLAPPNHAATPQVPVRMPAAASSAAPTSLPALATTAPEPAGTSARSVALPKNASTSPRP